ncbi:PREDICTED: uncharacterized protein LOC109462057 [Branchiostoma belcheri]|uniref:Uncharacterized protein LOC109462057 n=1 Tax=Branchiostoma belcheri TaxID=7741 RepID=A0A6P4XPV8_BRABE|nr:PREDICTED: uncharacterized protein LOC109462057 [Branchiostoma belcheri]
MITAQRTGEVVRLFYFIRIVVVCFCLAPCTQASLPPSDYRGTVEGTGLDTNRVETLDENKDEFTRRQLQLYENGKEYLKANRVEPLDETIQEYVNVKLGADRVGALDGNDDLTSDDVGSGAVHEGSFLSTEVDSTVTSLNVSSVNGEDNNKTDGSATESLCPQFCCVTNMSCFYILSNATRKPEVECTCDGFPGDPKTCHTENQAIWEELVESEETSRGICIEFHMKNALNETGHKINCHVEGVQDFTFNIVHWERPLASSTGKPTVPPDSQEVWLHYRPCVLYIEVNSTMPPMPAGINKTIQLVVQYIGTGLCFIFIGIIMTSCRRIKVDM